MMEKIVAIADKIIPFNWPSDKKAHFLIGALIGLLGTALLTGPIAFVLGLIAALGKEVYDEKSYGGFDWTDFAFTMAGNVTGIFIVFLLAIIVR